MKKFTRKASSKKRRLYISLLIFHSLVVIYPMLTMELIVNQRITMTMPQMGITELILVGTLIVVNCLFIKEFISQKWIFYLFCIICAVGVVFSTLGHVTTAISNNHIAFKFFNLISSIMVLCTLFITFLVAIKDIFKLKHDLTYSLIGAANMFLLIGSTFSFIVNIAGSIFTGMVVPLEQMAEIDIYANKLAFYTLANIDLPFTSVDPFIRDILVVESICAHLFVVMIIGRLLSK